MILVDSSGWIEFFTDGKLAEKYALYLEKADKNIVPALVIYEVYKKIKKELSEEAALSAIAHMGRCSSLPLDDSLALTAADISLEYRLAMADAIIYATAI